MTKQRKALQTAQFTKSSFEKAIESLTEATAAIKQWMQGKGLDDKKERHELEEIAIAISHLLRADKASKKQFTSKKTSGTLEGFGEFFIFRDGRKKAVVLAPVDIIKCEKIYTPEKNIAFFRMKGAYFPQLYAISGYTGCVEPHTKVLDSKYWVKQVRKLGDFHEHVFKSNGWDVAQGRKMGDGFACHSELQAMLASAFMLLQQFTGKEPTVGKLFLLQGMKTGKDIDIHISDEPCAGCSRFQETLELITGIKFHVTIMNNLGILEKEKNAKGEKKCPKYGWNGLDSELKELEALEGPREPEELLRSQAQVVIRLKSVDEILHSKPATPQKPLTTKVLQETLQQQSKTKNTAATTSPPSLPKPSPGMMISKIHRETFTSTCTRESQIQNVKTRKRKLVSHDDSDNDEYEPRSSTKHHLHNDSAKRKSPRTGLSSPNYSPQFDITGEKLSKDDQRMRRLSRDFQSALQKARYG